VSAETLRVPHDDAPVFAARGGIAAGTVLVLGPVANLHDVVLVALQFGRLAVVGIQYVHDLDLAFAVPLEQSLRVQSEGSDHDPGRSLERLHHALSGHRIQSAGVVA